MRADRQAQQTSDGLPTGEHVGEGVFDAPAPRERFFGSSGLESARDRIGEWLASEGLDEGSAHLHAMLVGLRRFDAVNLAYGEAAGDEALEEVAARMSNFAAGELEGRWLVSRAGGGSFLLLAAEPCSRERWQLVADELAEVVARPIAMPSGALRLSPRLALVRMLEGEAVDLMLDRLGQALSQATLKQGARIVWANGEATPHGRSSAQLEADLLAAIERDEIEVLFQPQFSLPDDRLVGAEALARWNHPELGRIGASALFAIAERTDHIVPLSRHIARKSLDLAQSWPAQLRLSLNVTAADLAFGSYARQLLDKLRETGFPPNRLTLEITEQSLIVDVGLAAQIMAEFAANGIRLALDDFGAGFCNFRYLKLLPLHYIKLDRSMVDGINRDRRDRAVLRAIVAMAKALDLEVIAEGIESEAQRTRVAAEGCAYYQGFVRAQPMSAEMFAKLVAISA
ncbi:EAL domain-containing protein (putative c-di-GMP-specific phosphodiesterase class I) [Novosphingobium chloroacetimidivorans]|uniref:EAL domain-containing protein (Putative c-di-GMP-specific phosphodiesterase class I) n=1 Tax=Novosphingobium chloroacetimidivorans TaxID=1428314 RepID=A0A7W7KBU3_9SPHN|nr:bifunctional diguanylate cyclase/phosphodiesterase [Novosphingobium chloroacetimidivorans]MBB4859937.1 EAL domain-containing protein (putative c-di-GMP-specific phosphodiesterase class I) [Novosphingobium chloroacetimidivorans]